MSGYREVGKAILKSFGKTYISKGSRVSTKKIPDGIVKDVDTAKGKITAVSIDGKQTETVLSTEAKALRIKKTKFRNQQVKEEMGLSSIPEEDLVTMRVGTLKNKLQYSKELDVDSYKAQGKTGNEALMDAFPTQSEGHIRARSVGRKFFPGLRRNQSELVVKKENKSIAKFEADQADAAAAKKQKDLDQITVTKTETSNRRRSKPNADMPEFKGPGGGVDTRKLIDANNRYEDNFSKERTAERNGLPVDKTKNLWKNGGSVNVNKKKKYREVTNRFSDRMLPNKKRTTRIY